MEFINISLKEGLSLAKEEGYALIDVREPYRFVKEHLKGAQNCPYGVMEEADKLDCAGKKLIVYCDFGGQSMMAARHLVKEGYEVYNIVGGVYYYLQEWKES